MAARDERIRRLWIKKGDSLKTIYAKARKALTADDLARFIQDDDETVPFEEVIAKLEAIQREGTPRPKKKAKKK
jgi:hypothetical protein